MSPQQHTTFYRFFLCVALLIVLVLTLSGCSYVNFFARKAHWGITFKGIPSMSALNNLAPEESLIVAGQLIRPLQRQEEPLLLVAVSNQYRQNEIVAVAQIQKTINVYMAFLPKGDYKLFIFADLDGNKDFESNEVVGRASVRVAPKRSLSEEVLGGPSITLDFDHPGEVGFRVNESVRQTSYVYATLDDGFFDPRFGTAGLYNPVELISHTQGFIFGLEDYDPEKTLVLFIHGVGGTPRDWKFIVDGLDRKRFQPFFFYYPSGLPLNKLGAILAQIINYISSNSKNHRHNIVLVAHSMGGLIALSAIHRLSDNKASSSIKMFCTFSTPYGGSDPARYWENKAPTMVPAWRDIATGSEFLQDLTNRPFPARLPFYLYFTYKDPSTLKQSDSGDGIVSLRSQLEPFIQNAATKIIGLPETHMGALKSPAARESFLRLLDAVVPYLSNGERKEKEYW
jgi:pimeloyl-ACP methyl ester carboxylesterase